MIKKLALGLFLLVTLGVVVILGFAMTKPPTFHVERSIVTSAPAAAVFPFVNDLHRFPEWSPWQELDPAMKVDYSGAESGVGASYHWKGNDKVGEGRMTITDTAPDANVVMKLEFMGAMASTNTTTFALAPEGEGTKITWSMDGKSDLMTKVMSVFMSMDAVIGKDFERGLAKLKTVAEAAPAPAAEAMPAEGAAKP